MYNDVIYTSICSLYYMCTIQVFSHMKSTTINKVTFSFCKHCFNIQIISKWYQILTLIPNPSTIISLKAVKN